MTVRWIEDNPPSRALPVWTRSYIAELAPAPLTPLGWELVWDGAAALGWRDALVGRLGFDASELDEDRPEVVGVFGGHAYLNVSALRLWSARVPGLATDHVEATYLGDLPLPAYAPEPWHEVREPARSQLLKWLSWVLVDQTQTELEAGRQLSIEARATRPDFAALGDTEVADRALSLKPLCRALVAQHVNQLLAASIGPTIVAAICAQIGSPTSTGQLISGLGGIETVASLPALWAMSRLVRSSGNLARLFDQGASGLYERLQVAGGVDAASLVAGIDALGAEVGFRGSVEWELHGPAWEREPDLMLAAVDHLRARPDSADPSRRRALQASEREALVHEIRSVVAGDPATRDQLDAALRATVTFARGRERSRSNVSRVIHEMRMAIRELGERAFARGDLSDPDDVYMLFLDELVYYADGGLAKVKEIADERRARWRWLATLKPPAVIDGAPPPPEQWPHRRHPDGSAGGGKLGPGDALLGKAGCGGVGRGIARIASEGVMSQAIAPGDVLVVSTLDPGLAPLMLVASAVVADTGGPFSHATVVARELGVPCVVNTGNASAAIPDGALVEVDGLAGVISIVEVPVEECKPADTATDSWATRAY